MPDPATPKSYRIRREEPIPPRSRPSRPPRAKKRNMRTFRGDGRRSPFAPPQERPFARVRCPQPMQDVFGPGGALARALPEYEPRPEQAALADAVERALATGEHLLAEAGTGVGKSLAYLVPALASGARVVVATATKALQQQLLEKDV